MRANVPCVPALKVKRTRFTVLSVVVLSVAVNALPAAEGRRGVIATVNPLATQAGLNAFQAGGNAVDAAIAAALTLGVVDSHNSGLGGGCFVLIHTPTGQLLAIDGRERAPSSATADMYVRQGVADAKLSQTGPLAAAVPGALAAYDLALRKAGRLPLAQLLLPAATLAADGHAIDAIMARNLNQTAADLALFPASRAVLLRADGAPWQAGDRLVQSDLALTYRSIAAHGTAWFYDGPFAQQVADWMQGHGGRLTTADFRDYRAVERTPIVTQYRDCTLIGFPPPSSGGVHVAQVLNMLEPFDLRELERQDPARLVHVVAEAMKLAFADRAYWLGDSDHVPVPRGLIDPEYAKQLAARIHPDQVTAVAGPGTPPAAEDRHFGKHTTHIAAADDAGNWVALTATVNTTFGSKVIVPGTGLILNNEMDDFSIQPGVPNAFGLVGNQNNAIAPGKRPLSSMSPTIVLQAGQPVLTLGAAGGPKIITQVILTLIRTIDLHHPLDVAVASPRWHHQWQPDRLFVEETLPAAVRRGLTDRGHTLEVLPSAGVLQAVGRTATGQFIGVHDPRVPGQALGFD